jgi:hypothetical protein
LQEEEISRGKAASLCNGDWVYGQISSCTFSKWLHSFNSPQKCFRKQNIRHTEPWLSSSHFSHHIPYETVA